MDYFVELLFSGLTRGAIYALIALGYTMVYGIIGMAAVIWSSAYGYTIEKIAYKPLRGAPRLSPLISAIVVIKVDPYQQVVQYRWANMFYVVVGSFFLSGLFRYLLHRKEMGERAMDSGKEERSMLSNIIATPKYRNTLILAGIVLALVFPLVFSTYQTNIMVTALMLQDSRIGRAWVALREDEIACQAMGIDKRKTKLTAFALGAFWAGIMGVFFAAKTTFINPASFTFLETRKEEKEIAEDSYAILEKVGLQDLVNEYAENLSYGAQRRLEIGRALATEPSILLLDEPAAGMNPQETLDLDELIREISSDGLAILLIEHDMKLVMSLSERIYVLDYGKKIAEGTPTEIRSNPEVIKAYLGE
ncbi:unnamed protein product [Cyprideis torosa]|uniref:Uncharacterized protein n=1 Tax=Cyprideis torosa TaxID=163714 RepID=A0A7R8WM49_9CRUS|nr:unnamed protein product [Cyprideis torosa]CAG0898890.1 unnamed protein product [Cyprideis torosa]